MALVTNYYRHCWWLVANKPQSICFPLCSARQSDVPFGQLFLHATNVICALCRYNVMAHDVFTVHVDSNNNNKMSK